MLINSVAGELSYTKLKNFFKIYYMSLLKKERQSALMPSPMRALRPLFPLPQKRERAVE
jgi:hypothetical protein